MRQHGFGSGGGGGFGALTLEAKRSPFDFFHDGKKALRGEGQGLALDFSLLGGWVKTLDVTTAANLRSNAPFLDTDGSGWLVNSGTSPKLVLKADGNYGWTAHNLALYSEDLTNWTNVNSSDSGAVLTAASGSAVHSITRVPSTLIADATYFARIKITAGTHSFAYLNVRGDGSEDFVTVLANLATGAITETDVGTSSGTIVSSSIVADGSGYYVSIVFTLASVSAPVFCVGMAGAATGNTWDSTGTTSFNAAGTETISIEKAQLNRGTVATTYLKTTTAARFEVPQEYDAATGKYYGLIEPAATNLALYASDFTQDGGAPWTLSNMTAAKTATGPDGVANSASTLTATDANATALQAITSASASRVTSMFVKRRTGSGNIDLTQDNGATWATQTVTASWTRVSLAAVTSANPTVGIRVVTSGDEIDVAWFQHELTAVTSPIPTFGATVTRAIDDPNVATSKFPAGPPWTIYAYMQIADEAASAQRFIVLGADSSDYVALSTASLTPNAVVVIASSTAAAVDTGAVLANTRTQVTQRYAVNSVNMSKDGGAVGTEDTSVAMPTPTTLRIGQRVGGGQDIDVPHRLSRLVIVPRAVSDADLPTWRYAA